VGVDSFRFRDDTALALEQKSDLASQRRFEICTYAVTLLLTPTGERRNLIRNQVCRL
jgi:hypothetical protein